MATKADFTDAEWKSIVAAAPMVGLAVAAASPNGPFGVIKEMMSVGMAMADVVKSGSNNPLITALLDDIKARQTRPDRPEGVSNPDQAKSMALDHLAQVAAMLDTKAGPDAAEFKQWLLVIANRVAEASNEGGFLGFGGTRVSEDEKQMIAQIAGRLGVSTSA